MQMADAKPEHFLKLQHFRKFSLADMPPAASNACTHNRKHTFCVAGTRKVGTLTSPPALCSSLAAAWKSSVFPPVHDLQGTCLCHDQARHRLSGQMPSMLHCMLRLGEASLLLCTILLAGLSSKLSFFSPHPSALCLALSSLTAACPMLA